MNQGRAKLWSRDYTAWFIADTAGWLASSMRIFIVPFFVFALTGSTASTGTLTTVTMVASLIASLPGGVIVDRYDRRHMIYAWAGGTFLVWLAIMVLDITGWFTIVALYGLVTLGTFYSGFFAQSTNAALRSVAPGPLYTRAQAMNQGRDAAVEIAAKPLAGFLFGIASWLAVAVSLACTAILAISTRFISISLRPKNVTGRQSFRREFVGGLRYLHDRPILILLVSISCLVNFGVAGIFTTINLTLMAQGRTAFEISFIPMAAAIAMIPTSIIASTVIDRYPSGKLGMMAIIWVCLWFTPLVLTTNYVAYLVLIFGAMTVVPLFNSVFMSFVFGRAPEHIQGRLTSVVYVASGSLAALAPIISGVLLEKATYTTSMSIFIASLAVCLVLTISSSRIRSIPAPAQWPDNDLATGEIRSAELS